MTHIKFSKTQVVRCNVLLVSYHISLRQHTSKKGNVVFLKQSERLPFDGQIRISAQAISQFHGINYPASVAQQQCENIKITLHGARVEKGVRRDLGKTWPILWVQLQNSFNQTNCLLRKFLAAGNEAGINLFQNLFWLLSLEGRGPHQ